MTKEQSKADMRYRLGKYVLKVLLDAEIITTEEAIKTKAALLESTIRLPVVWRRWTHGCLHCYLAMLPWENSNYFFLLNSVSVEPNQPGWLLPVL